MPVHFLPIALRTAMTIWPALFLKRLRVWDCDAQFRKASDSIVIRADILVDASMVTRTPEIKRVCALTICTASGRLAMLTHAVRRE